METKVVAKRAKRPVFISLNQPDDSFSMVREELFDFEFFPGFAEEQKRKNVRSLHRSIKEKHTNAKILEVSTKSNDEIGMQLSAFRLTLDVDNGDTSIPIPIENIFQSSKVFEHGGPFKELLWCPPLEAKRYEPLKKSGELKCFHFDGKEYALKPPTFFYDYIYIKALINRHDLTDKLLEFDYFTDIEFNQKKSLNCQARSVAILVALLKNKSDYKTILEDQGTFKDLYQYIDGYLPNKQNVKTKTQKGLFEGKEFA